MSAASRLIIKVWSLVHSNFHGFRDDTYLQKFRSLLVYHILRKPSNYTVFKLGETLKKDFSESLSLLKYLLALFAKIVGQHQQAREDIREYMSKCPQIMAKVYSSVEFFELMDALVLSEPSNLEFCLAKAQENVLKLLDNPQDHLPNNIFWRRSFFKICLSTFRKTLKSPSPSLVDIGPDSFPRRLVFHPNHRFKRSFFKEFIMGVIQTYGLSELKHSPKFQGFMLDWSQSPEIQDHPDCQILYGISIWKDVQSCVEPYFYPESKLITPNDLHSVLEPLSALIDQNLVCFKDGSKIPSRIRDDVKRNLETGTNMWRNVIIWRYFRFPELAFDHLKLIQSGDHDLSDRDILELIRDIFNAKYNRSGLEFTKNESEIPGLLIDLSLRTDLPIKSRMKCLEVLANQFFFNCSERRGESFEKRFDKLWILASNENWEIVDGFLNLLADAPRHSTISQSDLEKILNFLKICLDHENSFIRANVFNVFAGMCRGKETLHLLVNTKMSIPMQVREVFEHETEAVVRRSAVGCLSTYTSFVVPSNPPDLFVFETMYLAVLDLDWEVKEIALKRFWAPRITNGDLDPMEMSETYMVNVCLFVFEDYDKRNRDLFSRFIKRLKLDDPSDFDRESVELNNDGITIEVESNDKNWILKHYKPSEKSKELIRFPPKESFSVLMDKVKALDHDAWVREFDDRNDPAKELIDVMMDIYHYDSQSESEANIVDCV